MSNNPGGFPNVGVNFVAQNAETYLRTIVQAQAGLDEYHKRIDELVRTLNTSEAPEKKQREIIEKLEKQYLAAKDALVIYQTQLRAGVAATPNFIDKTQDSLEKLIQDSHAYTEASNTAARGNDKLGTHFTSLSSAIGVSRVGVGLFTRELVQLAGGGGVAVQALDSFVYSTGTLGLALGAITAGLIIVRGATDAATDAFKKQQTEIANTERDYASLYNRLQTSQRSGIGLIGLAATIKDSALEAATTSYGQQLGDSYGRAFTEAASGNISGALNAFFSNLNLATVWTNIGINAGNAFIEGFKRRQEENATQLFIQGAQTRANAAALGLEIGQLQIEGKTYDELIPKVYEYLRAKQAIGEAQGSGVGGAITGTDVEGFIQSFFPSQALSQKATALARQLRDIQSQYNDDSEQLAVDHASRLDEIASSGYEQQVRLAREYAQRIASIQAQYAQDTADAASDYAQRVADAEANAQESRTKITTDYADKRAQIEQDYQDRVAQIQSNYRDSLFEIVAKDDAKGLVRARLTRDKQLADAAKTRDKENADAQKQKEKQEKDLAEALAKQKRQLQQDYERRLRDLAQAFAKQNATANQNYQDSLADLQSSIAKQYAAENDGYRKRQVALDEANAKKKQSLINALVEDQNLSEKYAQAIIDSLKKILSPDEIIRLTNDLQNALDTKIEIKVTPNAGAGGGAGGGASGGKQEKTYAEGGYIGYTQRALIHAGETVLPRDPYRAYALATQHMGRVNMPMGSRANTLGGGQVTITIDNNVNSAILDSQIRVTSTGIIANVVKRALT